MQLYVIKRKTQHSLNDFFADDYGKILAKAKQSKYYSKKTEDYFHKIVYKVLGNPDRNISTVLYRNFGNGETIWIQTDAMLDEAILDECGYELSETIKLEDMYSKFKLGDICKIKMLVSPRKRNGKEKGNRKVFMHNYEDRLNWYKRQAEKNGFEIGENYSIPTIRENEKKNVYFRHNESKYESYYTTIDTEMIVKIKDLSKFSHFLMNGMSGSGRAYGAGLVIAKVLG